MPDSSIPDDQLLKELLKLIKNEKDFSEVIENEIISCFESRGENAAKILKEKKLHKLMLDGKTSIWEVEGRSKNYIIIEDDFCECTDFQIRVLNRGERLFCYHLLAKIIGEKLNIYDVRGLTDEEYNKLLKSKI